MGFIKKYPIFCVLLLLFVLVLGTGIYLALGERTKLAEAESALQSDLNRLRQVSGGVPYDDGERVPPTAASREKLEDRLEEVRGDLLRIRDLMNARTESVLNDPADEFTFLPKLQTFIARLKSEAASNRVRLESNEAFGFARYATRARQPSAADVPRLDLQRQVLGYILRQLIQAGPSAILAVERELVETPAQTDGGKQSSDDIFTIPEFVTARSNEYIDTYAFRLVFTGRTDVLRGFINRLAAFELPLIVRSIEVTPVEEEDEPEEETTGGGGDDALFALFGGGGDQPAETPEEDVDPDREPVITENKSKFTVVIEFVELRTEAMVETETETES